MRAILPAILVLASCIDLVEPVPRDVRIAFQLDLVGSPGDDRVQVTCSLDPGTNTAGGSSTITSSDLTVANRTVPQIASPGTYHAVWELQADIVASRTIEVSWPAVAGVDLPDASTFPVVWREGPAVLEREPGEDIQVSVSWPAGLTNDDLRVLDWRLEVRTSRGFRLSLHRTDELQPLLRLPATILPSVNDSVEVRLSIGQRFEYTGDHYVIHAFVRTDLQWLVIATASDE